MSNVIIRREKRKKPIKCYCCVGTTILYFCQDYFWTCLPATMMPASELALCCCWDCRKRFRQVRKTKMMFRPMSKWGIQNIRANRDVGTGDVAVWQEPMACNDWGKATGTSEDCWPQLRLQRRQPRNKPMDAKMTSSQLPSDRKTSSARLMDRPWMLTKMLERI